MAYQIQRDLRGKHPTDTYKYLVSVDNTGSLFDGTGSQVMHLELSSVTVSGSVNCKSFAAPESSSFVNVSSGSMFFSGSKLWIYTGTANNRGAGVGWATASLSV